MKTSDILQIRKDLSEAAAALIVNWIDVAQITFDNEKEFASWLKPIREKTFADFEKKYDVAAKDLADFLDEDAVLFGVTDKTCVYVFTDY